MIWIFSSWIEGTIGTKRSRENCWDLEQVVGVAENGGTTSGSHDVAMRVACAPTAVSWPPRSCTPTNRHPLSFFHQCVSQVDDQSTTITKQQFLEERERDHLIERKREREIKREQRREKEVSRMERERMSWVGLGWGGKTASICQCWSLETMAHKERGDQEGDERARGVSLSPALPGPTWPSHIPFFF